METIRRATPDDLHPIKQVLGDAYRPYLDEIEGLPDVSAVDPADLTALTVWVADLNGAIRGVAMASVEGSVAHLANVAVAPDAGGRGLGRALIDTVVDWARGQACHEIRLATHPDMGGNVVLYERLGWEVTSRSDHKVTMTRHI